MSISNEVVKFIAEIELDAQDRENFLQGLKECDKECSDLRDGILHLQNSLTKLRTEGKEDTKEFRRHRCNSFYFYIKPQLCRFDSFVSCCCNSFYFYIKPQLVIVSSAIALGCNSFYFYIKPQQQGCRTVAFGVVIHSISTSNHNNVFNVKSLIKL